MVLSQLLGLSGAATTLLSWGSLTCTGPSPLADISSCQLTESLSTSSVPKSWDSLRLDSGFSLTFKIKDDKLYGAHNLGVAPDDHGCCSDTLRVYESSSPLAYNDVDTASLMSSLFPNAMDGWAYTSHTFDITTNMPDVDVAAIFIVQVKRSDLSGALTDVLVAYDLANDVVIKTVDGDDYFDMYEQIGTLSTKPADSIFKIQHYNVTDDVADGGPPDPPSTSSEEWHANGISSITLKDGTPLLANTHRSLSEAFLLGDPWRLSASEGGGKIMQRFGNPTSNNINSHSFGGYESSGVWNGVHNVDYKLYDEDDRETITIFVNNDGSGDSYVYEFDINLVDEDKLTGTVSDSVFDTAYTKLKTPFTTSSQGGARSIGDGVYVVSSGGDGSGLYVIDSTDGDDYLNYKVDAGSLYDPFAFINVDEEE